jgi:hypothetical protein
LIALARRLGLALVLAAAVAMPPAAAEKQASASSTTEAAAVPGTVVDVSGHYYLEGIRETGSELLLEKEGRFRWYFTYGALDLAAEGRWQREGDRVVLLPDTFHYPPQYPETEFKRMQLRIDGGDLIPAWTWEGGSERGRYTRE